MTPKDWLYDKARREGWDEPVWNSNTCVMVNRKTYRLSDYEANKVVRQIKNVVMFIVEIVEKWVMALCFVVSLFCG